MTTPHSLPTPSQLTRVKERSASNPAKKVVTQDIRFNPTTGTRLNDPATGYIAKDGSYVVRNDKTGQIVQVSDRYDPNWKAPWGK